jgi:hypothetical protein
MAYEKPPDGGFFLQIIINSLLRYAFCRIYPASKKSIHNCCEEKLIVH